MVHMLAVTLLDAELLRDCSSLSYTSCSGCHILTCSKLYGSFRALCIPSLRVIFDFLLHLILHYWGILFSLR